MNNVYFAMALHFHQPVGNFNEILERAYQDCYKPFLDTFSKYPDLKTAFHISGNLLDYFEDRHPDFLDRVKGLVEDGRVEIMGGGYYEPIFQAIPRQDRLGQIKMSSDYSEKRFKVKPLGMWIPERVWLPELIEDFQNCGIKYSILDDFHLLKAGIAQDELFGYFEAVQSGKKIAIFPTTKVLRYSIPFKPPREITGYFRKMSKGKTTLFTYGDDAEKFGEWPWTHNWVYKRGWLNSFFRELVRNRDWIETVLFSEFLESNPPLREVEIPEASYEEMMEWSGGSWSNFLSKYPESEQMQRRMLYVSNRISDLKLRTPPYHKGTGQANSELRTKRDNAHRELYKAQTNCAYWHGVFGGIYHHHLRSAVYEHLINADKISDESNGISVKEADFYGPDKKAVILENRDFFICIDPSKGGVIRELDYKPESVNLINTLARRKESYHKKILDRINNNLTRPLEIQDAIKTMDERIKLGIFYDRYSRSCLIEHFIEKDLEMKDFARCNYIDIGDFAGKPYVAKIEDNKIILSRETGVRVTKKIQISSDTEIEVEYLLKNMDSSKIDTLFGVEFNIAMPYADSDRYSYVSQKDSFSIKDSQGGLGTSFIFSKSPHKIWHFPVMTVSQSERAYELSHQGLCIFPMWEIKEGLSFTIYWSLDV